MAPHLGTELISAAIDLAVGRGRIRLTSISPSDRSSQYTSAEFRKTLKAAQIRPSMGRTGSCLFTG